MKISAVFLLSLFAILGSLAITPLQAQSSKHWNLENNLALDGYDPVAYFVQGKALEGDSKILAKRQGVVYRFATQANRDLFVKSPEQYLPMYGGWCAYAMGESGEKVKVDPETFKIVNGKLYLFYNFRFNNTLKSWNKDESNLKRKADQNWIRIGG